MRLQSRIFLLCIAMKRIHNYDPVREMYDLLSADDITLEYAFMLFGTEREALRVMKHGISDGKMELYEMIGPVKRYLDVWEMDELARDMASSEKARNKIKEVFVSLTRKGRRKGER